MRWRFWVVALAVAGMIRVCPVAYAVGGHDWLVMEEASEEESAPSEAPSEPAEEPDTAREKTDAAPEGEQAAPEPAEPLGVLDPVDASVEFEVPRDRMWPAPQGRLVLVDTLVIRTSDGSDLERTEASPKKNQFRPRLDGCVRFSQEDVGRKLQATYQYTPVRVALLPPVIGTDYEDAWPTMLEVLTREVSERGYVLANSDDVADALVNLEVTEPSEYPKLARELDVGVVAIAGIGASVERVLSGFQSMGGTTITGEVDSDGDIDGHTTGPTTMSAVYSSTMNVTVGLRVYDGVTGAAIGSAERSGSKTVLYRRYGPTRRSLARELTEKVVAAVLDTPG